MKQEPWTDDLKLDNQQPADDMPDGWIRGYTEPCELAPDGSDVIQKKPTDRPVFVRLYEAELYCPLMIILSNFGEPAYQCLSSDEAEELILCLQQALEQCRKIANELDINE